MDKKRRDESHEEIDDPDYRQAVEHFNVSVYETQDYSDGSKLLQDACKENWF